MTATTTLAPSLLCKTTLKLKVGAAFSPLATATESIMSRTRIVAEDHFSKQWLKLDPGLLYCLSVIDL